MQERERARRASRETCVCALLTVICVEPGRRRLHEHVMLPPPLSGLPRVTGPSTARAAAARTPF